MQHEHQHVPVTALAFYKQTTILSGEGGYLHAYSRDFKRLDKARVFDGQAIHGIIVFEDDAISTAVVWGGPRIRIVFLQTNDRALRITPASILDVQDWILDAAFAPSTAGIVAAIITAHNALLTVQSRPSSLSKDGEQEAALHHQVTGSNCIFYSAHLQWLSSSRCLIASGTAFGDIILWSTVLDDGTRFAESQTHFSFSAHEGSVFGVRLSSQLNVPGLSCERVLASCSDDRTISLWDISDLTSNRSTLADVQTGTGFGSRPTANLHAPRFIAKNMGHISRIWHIRFLPGGACDGLIKIISFGEDASMITWSLRIYGDSYALDSLHTTKAHSGKNIWSVVVDKVNDHLLTGGADGAIALHPLNVDPQHISEIPHMSLQDHDSNDNFRAYSFVNNDVLLSTTDHGRVLRLDCSCIDGTTKTSEVSGPLSSLRGYSSISSVAPMAFIGGIDGIIYAYTYPSKQLSKLAQIGGKIAGLFAYKDSSGVVALFALSVGTPTAELFLIQDSDDHDFDLNPNLKQCLILPAGFVTTSFVHCSGPKYSYAVLGSRHGSIAVYCYRKDAQHALRCSKLLTQIHSKDAITALRWLNTTEDSGCEPSGWLLSTGRDGTFAMHALHLFDDRVELELVHQLSLPFGPNIEGLDILEDGRILVWGFKSKNFVSYDICAHREIMTVECGGAHRNWAFQPCESGGRFVWTKTSKVSQAMQSCLPYQLLNSGGHGREIKATAVSYFNSEPIIAIGAEDTNIKLFKIEEDGFKCLHTLRKHNTGIQQLRWHKSHLFSSGGFEEFFVWKVTSGIPYIGVGVVCESKHPHTGSSDLRIMGFDVADASGHAGLVITMAYSDSTLKLWHYYADRSWELVTAANYLTSCLTHAFRMGSRDSRLFSTATDGHIARWTLDRDKATLRWDERSKVHQNAIHSVIHISDIGDDTSLIITGGDDNAIGITRWESPHRMRALLIPRAHAAAVTGLAVLAIGDGVYWLASVSIDQRVKLWQLEVEVPTCPGIDGITVTRLQDVSTAVADVSSLELCRLDDGAPCLVTCGVSMDLWRLPTTFKAVVHG